MNGHDRKSSGSVFNIGSQNAASINNIGGDQTNYGPQHATANFTVDYLQRELSTLRQQLQAVDLPPQGKADAERALAAAEAEVVKPSPDKGEVARHLESFTQILAKAGALASAGTALIQPLQQLAAWLGPVGQTLLHLLPF